jgi:glycosyltransferase involved in cell wall biosynthesis
VLSVGWIARAHKRMDYVIREMARLPEPRPFLQLLGAMDGQSADIVEMGRRLLGPDGFGAASVKPEAVTDYYRAADCFVLASLREGFGRVYLEALIHGLPVVAHRHPVTEFVLAEHGRLGDLGREGELAGLVQDVLAQPADPAAMTRRRNSARDRFSWPVLAHSYRGMFVSVARAGSADPS